MADETPTAAPARKRTAPKSTPPRKAAGTAPATKRTGARAAKVNPVTTTTGDDGRERHTFALVITGETSQYTKFAPPQELADARFAVGTIYVPKGTREVRIQLIGGPAE